MRALPKISIVMPVLNRGDTIEKSLQSIAAQNYPNLELIIMDGGSNDATLTVINRYPSLVTLLQSKKDPGPLYAINAGIALATGDLICQLMADDWFEPGILQKVAECYAANPHLDIVTCGGRIVTYTDENKLVTLKIFNTAEQLALTFNNVCFGASAICCRFITKSFYQRNGLYFPLNYRNQAWLSSDKEFLLRAILNNVNEQFIHALGYNYFAHAASSTFGNNRKNIIKMCEEHMDMAQDYLKNKSLNWQQWIILHYWSNEQRTRLFVYLLLENKYRDALQVGGQGLRQYNIFFLGIFLATSVKVAWKKSWRWLSSHVNRRV